MEDGRDVQIGRNLMQLRGEVSRELLAAKMCDKGYKWSRTIVFNIETGKRSLKLQEASDVLDCLGLNPVSDLPKLIMSDADAHVLWVAGRIEKSLQTAARGVTGLRVHIEDFDRYLTNDVHDSLKPSPAMFETLMKERTVALDGMKSLINQLEDVIRTDRLTVGFRDGAINDSSDGPVGVDS